MKNKIFISGSIVFLTIVACVIPGLGQPAVPPLDMNSLPTIIALTANAATTQTAAVAPPTPAETATPTLLEAKDTATLEKLPDGSIKFTDGEAGFVVVFPKGWLTLRPNSEEFNSTFEKETKNEILHSQMEIDQSGYEPGRDRLYSYPLLPEVEKNFLFGTADVEWDPGDTSSIDENSMGEFFRDLETSGAIPGFRTDTARVYENGNQLKLIEVGGPFSISDGKGGFTPFYVTTIFFKPAHNGVVMMLFTYLKDYKLPVYTDVLSIIESIELLEQ